MGRCLICGAENKEGAKFCCECGAKLETTDGKVLKQPEAPTQPKEKKTNNSGISKFRNILIPTLVILFTILVAASMFLPCANGFEKGELAAKFIFLDNVEELASQVNAQDPLSLFNMVIVGSYFVGILLIVIFGIITIVKSIKNLINKDEITCLKPFTITLMSALQFFAMFYLFYASKPVEGNFTVITYGAGGILDIIILFVTIVLLTFNSVVNYIDKKEESLKTIIAKPIVMVLLAVYFLFGFGNFICNTESNYFGAISDVLASYNKDIAEVITPIIIVATALQIILFYIVCGSLNGGLKNKSRSVLIVAAVFMIILSSLVNTIATLACATPLMADGSKAGASFASMFIPNKDAAKFIVQGPGMKINTYMPIVLFVVAIVQQIFTSIDKKNKTKQK